MEDGVWQGTFNAPAGDWEYKAPLNDSWDENYGANATRDGPNIGLSLGSATPVKFYYSDATHWVTDNHNKTIAVAPGSFQSELGCASDWDPSCLRSWLQDSDGDGFYTFSARLPAGSYEAKVAINESWDENYGAGGAPGGANIPFMVSVACEEIFFTYDAVTHVLTIGAEGGPKGNLARARAHWVAEDTIAWSLSGVQSDWAITLHTAPEGGLVLGEDGVTGGAEIPLTHDPAGLSSEIRALFPHLASYAAFKLPADRLSEVPGALKGQLGVSAADASGEPVDATSLQIPGVLDDLYTYEGKLGVSFEGAIPTLRVWAPTAKSVKLHLFADSNPATSASVMDMTADPATGVWSITGDASWNGKFYAYEVEVFVRSTGRVEHNLVTDPYSVSLSRNSQRSQIVDLAAAILKPAGWDTLVKPRLDAPEDIALYELHVRDFSANDPSVPSVLRGTFKAFTEASSQGVRHLAALARAGLTHVHLLPSFDIATVDEDKSNWQEPAGDLASFPPDSELQQAAVTAVADEDAFNWGYDPWHYTVPEGSHATDTDGWARILEFRQMVQALNQIGLRVVMDVVYNHTTAAGQNDKSVLDRVVPGYYHRLNADGDVETSSCCQNTASEHNMMEKLLIDSALTWATAYKVDGFRFDLMGHHMKRNMIALRQRLDALTPAHDGVDGKKVYVYGEGWNFGEVANNARGVNATQLNMPGTGIGTFSDRLRDGARGGGPFSGIQEQGFLTGLFYDSNATNQGTPTAQKDRLLHYMDWIRVGLAGNLADYEVVDQSGNLVRGSEIDYNGQPAGYTADPQEVINYVEAHDNETLFDAIQLKAPVATGMDDRVRVQNLGMSLLVLGQGIPFFHAGVELLRSKSLDRNSYNSGDWFNKLDFGYTSNNWGVGLPPARDNQANWAIMRPLLANPALDPSPSDILGASAHFQEVLAIRKSSRLFRLRTAGEIASRLRFENTGPDQIPGLIVLRLTDADGRVDRRTALIVALINANGEGQSFPIPDLTGKALRLHPVQTSSSDPVMRTASYDSATGTFSVPARTAAVFVSPRPLDAQIALLIGDVDALVAAGALTHGQGNALESKLDAARRDLARGDLQKARDDLNAFIKQVEAFMKNGPLTGEQGNPLIEEAQAIRAQL
jgi:pullulanase-type alpha-1,6-glucosidase